MSFSQLSASAAGSALTSALTCVGWDCFHFCPLYGNCSLTHRLRLCNEGDPTFITNMCWILVLCQVLALVSTYRLNALADYEKLWKASRKTPCFGMAPVAHRSLIYKFIKERKPKKLKMALEDCTAEAAVRQNPAGFVPTTFAIKEGAALRFSSTAGLECRNHLTAHNRPQYKFL